MSSEFPSPPPPAIMRITLYRHGPKQGMAGALTEEGRQQVEHFFRRVLAESPTPLVAIEYSPIPRVEQTARIYAMVREQLKLPPAQRFWADERLSEGAIAEHEAILHAWGGLGGRWLLHWHTVRERPHPAFRTGTEALADLAGWLLDKFQECSQRDSHPHLVAFSHGPLLALFFLALEAHLAHPILPEGWLERGDLFETALTYLAHCDLFLLAPEAEEVELRFGDRHVRFPLAWLRSLQSAHG